MASNVSSLFSDAPGLRPLSFSDWLASLRGLRSSTESYFESPLFGDDIVLPFNSGRSALCFWLNLMRRAYGIEVVILAPRTCEAVIVAARNAGLIAIQVAEKCTGYIDEEDLTRLVNQHSGRIAIVRQNTLGFQEWKNIADTLIPQGTPVLDDDCLTWKMNQRSVDVPTIFSLELSKIVSVGWGGGLRVSEKDANLKLILQAYSEIGQESFSTRCRKYLQAFVYWLLEGVNPLVSLKVKSLFFRIKLFQTSSFYDALCYQQFVKKLPAERIKLANIQFRKASLLFLAKDCSETCCRIEVLAQHDGIDWCRPDSSIMTPRFLVRLDKRLISLPADHLNSSWFNGPCINTNYSDPDIVILNIPNPLVKYDLDNKNINSVLSQLEKIACVE